MTHAMNKLKTIFRNSSKFQQLSQKIFLFMSLKLLLSHLEPKGIRAVGVEVGVGVTVIKSFRI